MRGERVCWRVDREQRDPRRFAKRRVPTGYQWFETRPGWGAKNSCTEAAAVQLAVSIRPTLDCCSSSPWVADCAYWEVEAGTSMKRTIQVRISRGDCQFVA